MNSIPLPLEDVYATRKKIEFVLEQLNAYEQEIQRPARILDFGCGNAEQLGKFVVGSGRTYVGVDMHEASLKHAKAICQADGVRFSNEVPQDLEFDVILVSEVLEHLDDPTGLLTSLVVQLNKNGCVIGSIPNGYGLTEIEKFIIHKTGLYLVARGCYRLIKKMLGKPVQNQKISEGTPYNHASGHVQFFTKKAIHKVLETSGLEVTAFQNGSVMGADLSGSTFLCGQKMIGLNIRLAQSLPHWASATWHFAARVKR
jgi:2-polyprenyl-3-methyl-5-hydroxy-6-metoxy-1,4-benzoquinol methylase